jgi:hypothetical protein
MLWKVSHNNAPEVFVEADTEAEAVREGLVRAGVPADTPHPVRAWPADRGETKESLAAKVAAAEKGKA